MFSRITHCIPFSELGYESKRSIIEKEYAKTLDLLDSEDRSVIENNDIENWFLNNVERCKNIRTMKTKLDNAIWGTLTDKLLDSSNN